GSHHRCWVDAVSVTGQFSIPLAVPVTTVITRCRHQFVQQTVLAWDIFRFPSGPQEGQLIETEATGAPQKHHHTLNQ
ncbi:hypothetical protein, partial [Escherichia coli]|uniref:hypothetical protein n=1 Tax=Escherichia coli TaxID=562 RepID=UPI001BEA21D6